jgi:hypothetical protein
VSATIQQLKSYSYKPKIKGYTGPTHYMDLEIAPWNHIQSLVNEMLANVQEWYVVGLQLNSPMGKGKTKFAEVLAHHIHTTEPKFKVIWASGEDFKHIEKFLESLPKYQPVIIIWDDITSVLKQMKDTELHQNFNALTRIRHILDPEKGQTPSFIITTGHYSKNVEKEFRNVMEYVGFVSWTNEEHSNMDSIAPKKTQARYELKKFIKLYTKIASAPSGQKKFSLRLGNQKMIEYEYSKPTRLCCVVFGTEAKILHFAEFDCCELCSKRKFKRVVPAKAVYDKIIKAYGNGGLKALRLHLWKNGYQDVFYYNVSNASKYIEQKLFTEVSCDKDDLMKLCYTESHKAPPKEHYRKRKLENQISNEMYEIAKNEEITQQEKHN